MGLDMYLTKKTYIGAEYEHRAITGTIDLYTKERPIKINFKRVSEICESVGYWRKANQIHKWFVDNVQDGEDDCKPYDVSEDKLKSLLTAVNAVLDAKNTSDEEDAIATHLPPTDGFFFGSTFIDDWYWDQIEYTKQTITEILQEIEQDKDDNMWVTYVYQSSW